MAVALRMQRHGAKKRPFYHIVATDRRNARDGRYLEQLGIYDPRGDKPLALDEEKVLRWLQNGATPSETVKRLIQRAGIKIGMAPSAGSQTEAPKAVDSAASAADDSSTDASS